jgi:DNA-binding transcriptional regulator YhcF (GntR family)
MSVTIMSLVYKAHFHDITFMHEGKKKTGEEYKKAVKVSNFNLKSVCLALADHANDEGEGAYPAVEKIAIKTEISEVTVIACLKAMKQEGIITYVGRSKWDTCNYTVNKAKLTEMATWERQKRLSPKSKAALVPAVKPLQLEGKAAIPEPSLHQKPSSGAGAPLPLDWQIAMGAKEIVIPDNTEAQRKDIANLIAMGMGTNSNQAYQIALAFMDTRNILIPESKVKGQRKAVREMLEMHVAAEHVKQAVADLVSKGMTVTDLFSVSKTAIDLANPAPVTSHRLPTIDQMPDSDWRKGLNVGAS